MYLPDRKREYFVDDDDVSLDSELSLEGKLDLNNPEESARFGRRNHKRGMLGWFKLKVFFIVQQIVDTMMTVVNSHT